MPQANLFLEKPGKMEYIGKKSKPALPRQQCGIRPIWIITYKVTKFKESRGSFFSDIPVPPRIATA